MWKCLRLNFFFYEMVHLCTLCLVISLQVCYKSHLRGVIHIYCHMFLLFCNENLDLFYSSRWVMKYIVFPPQYFVHWTANSPGALHHEACLSRLLQKDVPQQYRLHQSPRTYRGVITLHFCYIPILFFSHSTCDLNYDWERHCHQRKKLFECQDSSLSSNSSVYLSSVEDQPVEHWSLMVIYFIIFLLWPHSSGGYPDPFGAWQTSAVLCIGYFCSLLFMSLFIHIVYSVKKR